MDQSQKDNLERALHEHFASGLSFERATDDLEINAEDDAEEHAFAKALWDKWEAETPKEQGETEGGHAS
jgi:hypothetical protein